ncbi:MAG: hypothetical protein MMC33_000661 [Icmadophila ericetorum]|nr:hypothetical protein [Icmadophila ericetorum]
MKSLLVIIFAICICVLYLKRCGLVQRLRAVVFASTPKQKQDPFWDAITCRRILACTGLNEADLRNKWDALVSRAVPNQRLKRAFGIDNAFTTTNKDYHKRFRRSVEFKLKMDAHGWKDIADSALAIVRNKTERDSYNRKGIQLGALVQSLTFRISLRVLFSQNPLKLDENDVESITHRINYIWIHSKLPMDHIPLFSDQRDLQEALKRVLPDHALTPRETPLNYILPGYETTWRVTLRCAIEVIFRDGKRHTEWRDALKTFLANPTMENFEKPYGSCLVSVSFIVSEALRLYPPTRRVFRAVHLATRDYPEIIAADVENCHRNPAVWGEDAFCFLPARWGNIDSQAVEAFIPFGGKPFTCPAKQEFGPRMIGVLVAALVVGISEEYDWRALCPHDEISSNEPLALARDSYETLTLVRKDLV